MNDSEPRIIIGSRGAGKTYAWLQDLGTRLSDLEKKVKFMGQEISKLQLSTGDDHIDIKQLKISLESIQRRNK